MAGFNVLKHTHVMIGIPLLEWHDYLPPPGITPAKAGHICGGLLSVPPWGILSGKKNNTPGKTVETATSYGMSRGTDMGPLIPHYNVIPPAPPNLLLPVIILFSGSKSHFGASTVLFEQGQAAFAVAVKVNFNLNCAGPTMPPLPSGLVIAEPQTVEVGVTVGDMIAGFLHMAVDLLIQFGLNRLFGGKNGVVGNWLERLGPRLLPTVLRRVYMFPNVMGSALAPYIGSSAASYVGQASRAILGEWVSTLAAFVVGGPVGYSPGWTPIGGYGGGLLDSGHDAAQQAIDDHFTGPGDSPFIGE
jgi:hypothetical protein